MASTCSHIGSGHPKGPPKSRERVVERLKELGYSYVTVDLAGFRSGSMNETLTLREVRKG